MSSFYPFSNNDDCLTILVKTVCHIYEWKKISIKKFHSIFFKRGCLLYNDTTQFYIKRDFPDNNFELQFYSFVKNRVCVIIGYFSVQST